jgi:glycosyltransferase involved in cell wall biosynthesis
MPEGSLGLIMILRNEAANLERSLAPIASSFDEVVVVDTGSTDGTAERCVDLGARVFEFAWQDDFAAARNYSINKARADWLFWLDGDNAITPQMVADLRRSLPLEPALLWALEQLEPKGGELWQKRCFPRCEEAYFSGRVHEQLVHPPAWPSIATSVRVRHWGYADHGHAQAKGRYYLGLLSQMLEDDPGDYYARFQLGRTHYNLRDFNKSIEQLRQVIKDKRARTANPQVWSHAHFYLAQAFERMTRIDDAEYILEQLLEIDSSNGLGHFHRGRLAYYRQDWETAAKHFARALRLGLDKPFVDVDPSKTLFLAEYYLGRCYERLGRADEARTALERAALKQPDNPAPRTDLARLLLAQGQSSQAKTHLKQILDKRPDDRAAKRLWAQAEAAV